VSNKNLSAVFIAIGMAIWLFSGELASNIAIADDNISSATTTRIPHVRAVRSEADVKHLYLEVSGQTRANRIVQVKAEVFGRVEGVPAIKGTVVKKGDVLCKIAIDTRKSDLAKAIADLKSARLEFDGILDLKRQGLQSDINVARAEAALESSRADSKRAELALAKTMIIAPFDGVVETQSVEIGDFLNVGQNCATLMEIDPVLIVGQVAEKSIGGIKLGGLVTVTLISGDTLEGEVSFIGRSPDSATRTYPIEVTVNHPGDDIRAGLSAQMKVPVGMAPAHLISSASLVLNDDGVMGVRIVDGNNVVHFEPVVILSETTRGVWVSGLSERVNLITIGHEEVFEGQVVKADFTPLGSVVGS